MKKVVNLLVPFLVLSSITLVGCKNGKKNKDSNEGKVLLSFGDMNASGVTEIDVKKLSNLVASKDSFILTVSSTTCSCWATFKPVVEKYITENKLVCYQITYDKLENPDIAAAYGLYGLASSTTTFAIFENGKVVKDKVINSNDNKKTMEDYSTFKKFMGENVIKPGCFFINKENVEQIKNSGKNAVIYFERTECGDCNAVNPGILRSYVSAHSNMNKVYVLDCQDLWRRSSDEDYQSYLDAKDELGLSTKNNPTYGYGSGVFPFFSFIENGEYSTGAVIYNDTVEKQENKYVVTDSYYTTERVASLKYNASVVKNMELTADDVDEVEYNNVTYCSWNHDAADKVYKSILYSFLDYCLPKVNHNF